MLRPLLFFSTFLLISARVFEQSERRYDGAQDVEDECLVYEDEVIFLDSLQPTSSPQYEQPSSLSDQTSNDLNYLPSDPKPGKYEAFELLDKLYQSQGPIEFLDTLRPPVGESDIELLDSIFATPRLYETTTMKQPTTGKYDGFELLDTLYTTTEPLEFLNTLRPIQEPSVEYLDTIATTKRYSTQTLPSTTHIPSTLNIFGSLYDRSPIASTYAPKPSTMQPIVTRKHHFTQLPSSTTQIPMKSYTSTSSYIPTTTSSFPVPTATSYQYPSKTSTSYVPKPPTVNIPKKNYVVQPVRDHLEIPDRKTYSLPSNPTPNKVESVFDQFEDSSLFGSLYDRSPVASTYAPKPTNMRPIPTTKRPFTRFPSTTYIPRTSNSFIPKMPTSNSPKAPTVNIPKKNYVVQPVRDYMEVPDRSTYIVPLGPIPNKAEPVYDQFDEARLFGSLYDRSPVASTYAPKPSNMQPFAPVVDEFVTRDMAYSYAPKYSVLKPAESVLDQFGYGDVIYPRPKRSVNDSKRKCLKWRPKKVVSDTKVDAPSVVLETSTHSTQSNREVKTLCVGHHQNDLVSIGNCKKFYVRCSSEPKLMMCTRHGEIFSKALYGCVSKSEAPECPSFVVARPISATIPIAHNGTMDEFCQLRTDGFYRHFSDCSRVIQCFDGDAFEYPSCPKKLVFDEKRGLCEYKRNVPVRRICNYEHDVENVKEISVKRLKLLGWASLAVGIYLYIEHHRYANLAPSSYSAMSTAGLCVCAGCTVVIMAFIGCIGASIGSKWLLYLYTTFLALLVLVQITTGAMGFLHDDLARERVKQSLYSTINRTHPVPTGPQSRFGVTWDYMQKTLQCCGVENFTDWYYATQWPTNRFIPDSCCNPSAFQANASMKNCGTIEKHKDYAFKQGCYELFADWLLHHLMAVKMFSVSFVLIEAVLLILTALLISDIRKYQKRREPTYRFQRDRDGDDRLFSESTR
ncbi:Tetraspanin [Aphelenchoides besseyi]|nr:Tetraspanin [Aphelenchoides besseyi]